ncbi:MAG: DUF2478 domain-containing protein [Gammaproteobacteria bacterium]|nr:DUF2478 domain-containing protein [Gammaproteobacteria bacterium]
MPANKIKSSIENDPEANFAAAVYEPDSGNRMALLKFVEKLMNLNVRVGGVLQEAVYNSENEVTGLNAINVATGQRMPISRPAKHSECGLDVSALAETSGIIRQAIDDQVDLIVVEKFGELEQDGRGLIDEILLTISEGIPLLISVPKAALPIWQERSGELGSVLAFSEEAFEGWWKRLIE